MEYAKLLEHYSLNDFPVGLGGCHTEKPLPCCEHNITVFDDKKETDLVVEYEGNFVKIHHGSINESSSNVLIQLSNMRIVQDDQWELRMFLSKIKQKQTLLFKDAMKNSLFDALFCNAKAKESIKNNDNFAPCWIKSAAFYLADALAFYNKIRPSPTHFLYYLRKLTKNPVNEKLAIINECIGIERASPFLLDRMSKSTMGFSEMVEENEHSKIIRQKHDFLVKNSLISDCYFYLGYVNRNNLIKIKNSISKRPDLIHVLKVAFDIENDAAKLENQSKIIQKTANEILALVG